MITKYVRKFQEDDLIECLIRVYMRQCLSGGNVEYVTGSANTIGMIIGYMGIDPDRVAKEAKRRKEHERSDKQAGTM